MQITVKILNGQEVRLEVCGKSEKWFWYAVEGLRPVRFLYLKELWETSRNVEKHVYYISEVYDCNTHAHLCSDLTDFSSKKSFDANTALILYSFLVSKIMYMYRSLKMTRSHW